MTTSTTPPAAPPAPTSRFTIHVVADRFGDEPADYEDPDGSWPRLLANAPLGNVLVDDQDIEAVATEPLTLILTPSAGQRLAGPSVREARFVATLGATRLYAGRVMSIATARALRHPVVHIIDTGLAVKVQILPRLGDRGPSALVAPPAVIDHFRATGRLMAPGTSLYPTRGWAVEATSGKPGAPASRIEGACAATGCTLDILFRGPGARVWEQRDRRTISADDFDSAWSLVERYDLMHVEPRPSLAAQPVDAISYSYEITATRRSGPPIARKRTWTTPSTADVALQPLVDAAIALAKKSGTAVPVRYFRGA
jgi:hypothetical protein